jgi:hypothetical protein
MASPLANLRAMVSTANRSAGSGRRLDRDDDMTTEDAHQPLALLPAVYCGLGLSVQVHASVAAD